MKEPPADLLRRFDDAAAFTFALTSGDPAFDNYTEIDGRKAEPTSTIYHFDNTADRKGEVFGKSLQLLHPPGDPFTDAVLPVRPKLFAFMPARKLKEGNLTVIEPLSRQVVWQSLYRRKNVPVQVDLRRLPDGRYSLYLGKKLLMSFYLTDRAASQLWGAVSIYPGGTLAASHLPEDCRAIDTTGAVQARTFSLGLASRKTFWRYYIVDCSDKQDFSHYELTAANRKTANAAPAFDNPVSFSRMPEPTRVSGHAAWIFESQAPLPLLLSPVGDLSLSPRPGKNGKKRERTIRLPYAQPGPMVLKEGTEQKQYCSEIFVYV